MDTTNLLENIAKEDIELAFADFYKVLLRTDHYRSFFTSEKQIQSLVGKQTDNFFASLQLSTEEFKANYFNLGLMHAKMGLPFEDMVSALTVVRDSLLKNTNLYSSHVYQTIEDMEHSLAKGYLIHDFAEAKSQLDIAIENLVITENKHDLIASQQPLVWLKRLITEMQNDTDITHSELLPQAICPLTHELNKIDIDEQTRQKLHSAHHQQHSLASSMAFFYRDHDYMLANFMFAKLVSVTFAMSNQLGLISSQHAIEELHYDALTGLLLRHSLEQKLQQQLNSAVASHQPIAVLMLDLDYFKKINDCWGHQAGDLVLQTVGDLIKKKQRGHDLAFRYGGEEFMQVLSNIDTTSTQLVAERFRKDIENLQVTWQNQQIPLTMSIGGVVLESFNHSFSMNKIIEQADKNLYTAKANGRNQVVITQQ